MWFIFVKILFMSAAMSVSGLLVMAAARAFSCFLSKRCIYYLWLIPIIAGIIPFGMTFGSVSDGFAHLRRVSVAEQSSGSGNAAEYSAALQENAAVSDKADGKGATVLQQEKQAENGGRAKDVPEPVMRSLPQLPFLPKIPYSTVLSALYFAAVMFTAAYRAVRNRRFRRLLRSALTRLDSEMAEDCRTRVGVRRKAEIYSAELDCSPFVYGLVRPRIVVPRGKIEPEALIHEFVHIKRHDLLYMLLVNTVKLLHFFNPLVYVFAREIKRFMELSCDEYAAELMTEDEKMHYSRSIICYAAAAAPGTACLSENGENIKERINTIMNGRSYTRAARITGILIMSVLVLCQAVFAAAVNGGAPKKAYIINQTDSVYSVTYMRDGKAFSNMVRGIENGERRRAVLVNSEFYKGFAADVKLKLTSRGHYSAEDGTKTAAEEMNADMHIEMDKFIKAIDNGRQWQGTFTVTLNGENVLTEAVGYINNVPHDGVRNSTRLYISDGDTYIDISEISFDMAPDSRINYNYEQERLDSFEITGQRSFKCDMSAEFTQNGKKQSESKKQMYVTIYENREESRLRCDEIPFVGRYFISTIPGERYKYENDSAEGRFFLKLGSGIIADEFEGVMHNISTDKIGLESKDKSISVLMTVTGTAETFDYVQPKIGLDNGLEDGSDFTSTCVQEMHALRLTDIPLTLTLNEDKTKVILKIKDDFKPLGWCYSYSSYGGGDKEVYNRYHSKFGARETVLDICSVEGVSHNLQFFFYNSEPYVQKCYIDIMFKIVKGEIVYRCCNEYTTENKKYSGEQGFELMEKYLLQWENSLFKDWMPEEQAV